jgi:uncharacterized membrane protein
VSCRHVVEIDEMRHRAALQDFRASALFRRRWAAMVLIEETERLSLGQVEQRHWSELTRTMLLDASSTTYRELWETAALEAQRCVVEEIHARSTLMQSFTVGLDKLDLLDLCHLEHDVRRSIEKRERRTFSSLVQGTMEVPSPRTFATWSQVWSRESHLRNAMAMLEVKHRHCMVKEFVSIRDLWRREHWMRRLMFLMRCLQLAEMKERRRIVMDEILRISQVKSLAWRGGVALATKEQRSRFEMDAQHLLFDSLRLSDLESRLRN